MEVGGGGWGEGNGRAVVGGWVGSANLRPRQPSYLLMQELTETATVGLDHGKGRGGRRGPIGTSMPPH